MRDCVVDLIIAETIHEIAKAFGVVESVPLRSRHAPICLCRADCGAELDEETIFLTPIIRSECVGPMHGNPLSEAPPSP